MKYRFKVEILENSVSGRASRAYVGDVEVMERSLSRAAAVVTPSIKLGTVLPYYLSMR